jgi:hypothetical protein
MNTENITLGEMITCAKRELALRKKVYPAWVQGLRMEGRDAEREIQRMAAIVRFLERQNQGELL